MDDSTEGDQNLKKTIQMACIFTLLLSLAFLHFSPFIHAQSDTGTLDGISGSSAGSEMTDGNTSEKVESLTLLAVMYSEQLEEYDRSNGVFVITCISFCGVVLGLAITFVSERKEVRRPNMALAAVFALLPAIMTLCLYVFSMQCRRVAIFRGYLSYLEERLSELTGVPMMFNRAIAPKFFGEFNTNKYGPAAMIFFIVLLYVASIWLCSYFAGPSVTVHRTRTGKWATRVIFIVFALCIGFCGICVYDLATNEPIPNQVYEYCKSIAQSLAD